MMMGSNNLLSDQLNRLDAVFFLNNQACAAAVSTRQLSFEPSVAGADRAMSWSIWAKPTNRPTDGPQRVFEVAITTSTSTTNQYILSWLQEASTVPGKIRFILHTNASNFIYIQSANRVPRNRWTHIVITYDGSEANTGFEMYINGVIQGSPTRNLTGTYTGALNNANLRLQLSCDASATPEPRYTGYMRDFAIWDKELNQTEVNELFNGGLPIDVETVSFYGNIEGYWPLRTDLASENNSPTFDFADVGGDPIEFRKSNISINRKAITIFRADDANTRYVAFGGLFYTQGTTLYWNGRSGTTHLANGKIVKHTFDYSTEAVGAASDIITDGSFDLRGGSAGVINGTIYNFYSRYNTGADTFQDINRNPSSDGLTGSTFAGATTMSTTRPRYNFYGKVIPGFAAGHYFVPEFENTSGTTYTANVWKTEDNGSTWNKIQINDSGAEDFGELAIINLGVQGGNNTLLILGRAAGSTGLWQSVSSDGGATWSAPAQTNLGTGQCNCDMELDEQGRLVVIYMDRAQDGIFLSTKNYVADILADPTDYVPGAINVQAYAADSLGALGYPNIVRTKGKLFAITFSLESSSSRADLFFGHGVIFDNEIQDP